MLDLFLESYFVNYELEKCKTTKFVAKIKIITMGGTYELFNT